MAYLPAPSSMLRGMAIEWHPSQRDNVRQFVQNWFDEHLPRCGDTLSSETMSLVYQLILDDVCTEQHTDRVTYDQVVFALKQERRAAGVGINKMINLAWQAWKEQRDRFESERFDRPLVPRTHPQQETQWTVISA